MAKPQTWGSPIWGFTRPYPGTNTYSPGGPAPGQSPPPSYSTARPLPPSFPPVNLNDQDDELTDEDRELLELTGGIPTPGPRPTPTPPPGGAGIYPDASSDIPGSPGIWEPGMAVPEDAEVTWRQIPQKDRRGNIIGYLSAQVLVKKKAQAKEKSPNLQSVAQGGQRYVFNPSSGEHSASGLPGPQPPPGGVNPKQYVDDAGTTYTWVENDAGQMIPGTYRAKPVERPGDQYKPVPATWHPEDTGIPGISRYYAKDAEGREVPGSSQLIRQPQAPKPTWQPSGQTENVTMRPGGPMPFGLAGQWTGPASVVPFEQLRDEQGNARWQQQQTSAPPRELVNLQRQTATEQELIDLQRKIAAGQIPGTLTDIRRTSSDIEGQQLAAKEAAEARQQQGIKAQAGAYKAAEMSNPRSWINNALQAGQTPTVPPRLAGIIGQAPGTPLQKKPPVMPTADMWRTLTDADKDALFGYLSWVGIDPQEWMMQLSRQWSPWGAGAPDMGARFGVVRQR